MINYDGYIVDYDRLKWIHCSMYDGYIALRTMDASYVAMYPSKSSYEGYIALKFKYIASLC